MPPYTEQGIVLRSMKLGEADKIVTILTQGSGKVRAVAKGVRKTTSRFGAAGRLAWQAGGREIAHLHAAPFVDLRLPREARTAIAADPRLVRRAGRSDWIECRMESPEDMRFVATLIRRLATATPRRRP